MFQISRNSAHFKFTDSIAQRFRRTPPGYARDLCQYVRMFFLRFCEAVFIDTVAVGAVFSLLFAIVLMISTGAWLDLAMFNSFGGAILGVIGMFVGIAICTFAAGITLATAFAFVASNTNRFTNDSENPPIAIAWIKGKINKYCHTVTFTD